MEQEEQNSDNMGEGRAPSGVVEEQEVEVVGEVECQDTGGVAQEDGQSKEEQGGVVDDGMEETQGHADHAQPDDQHCGQAVVK